MKERSENSIRVLLRISAFRRLWAAITVSSFGDWMGLLATTSLAAYLTRDTSSLAQGAAVSGVLLTRLAPDLLLGPIAGSVVDRVDRRRVAIIGDTLAGLLYLSIAFAGTLTWLLVAQFLVEAVGLFSNPAKQAMWVNVVPRERLAVANQLNYVSIYGMVPVAAVVFALLSTVAQFFGAPTVAGADEATSLFSGGPTSAVVINIALLIDAATYFVAAATIFLSRRIIPSYVGERTEARSIFGLIAEGISFISGNRIMRAIYIGILGAFGAGGLVAGVAQLYVSALGAGTAGYGILFGSVFTGLALGMLIGPKVLPTVPRRTIFTSAIGAAGVMLVVMSLMGDFVGAAITSIVLGLFAGIAWINGFTMIGQEVSDRLRGRVFAFVMSSVRITLLATIALGPVVAGFIGAHQVSIGQFRWLFSGPAVVLAIGGVIAFVVSLFAARQVGGGAASRALRRALRRRGGGLLGNPVEHGGVLIAIEGADRELVVAYREAVAEHIRSVGYRAIAQQADEGWPAPPSFANAMGSAGGARAGFGWPPGSSGSVTAAGAGPSAEAVAPAGAHVRTGVPAVATRSGAGGGGDPRPAPDPTPASALRALADLSDRVSGRIRPELDLGAVVVSSDYVDATVVRFGACGGLDEEQVLLTAIWAVDGLLPDLTVLVDGPDLGPASGDPPGGAAAGFGWGAIPDPGTDVATVRIAGDPVAAGSGHEAALVGSAGVAEAGPAGDDADSADRTDGAGSAAADRTTADRATAAGATAADRTTADGAGSAAAERAGSAAAERAGRAADNGIAEPRPVVMDAEAEPVDERAAYRDRASTAPERYVIVYGPPAGSGLDVELAGRVDSVLRQRAPALAEPVATPT